MHKECSTFFLAFRLFSSVGAGMCATILWNWLGKLAQNGSSKHSRNKNIWNAVAFPVCLSKTKVLLK